MVTPKIPVLNKRNVPVRKTYSKDQTAIRTPAACKDLKAIARRWSGRRGFRLQLPSPIRLHKRRAAQLLSGLPRVLLVSKALPFKKEFNFAFGRPPVLNYRLNFVQTRHGGSMVYAAQ
jgi:hypothetical protein